MAVIKDVIEMAVVAIQDVKVVVAVIKDVIEMVTVEVDIKDVIVILQDQVTAADMINLKIQVLIQQVHLIMNQKIQKVESQNLIIMVNRIIPIILLLHMQIKSHIVHFLMILD